MVYVGTSGPRPQGAGASPGYLHFCPTGCPGRPLGGGWYRAEGLLPQGLAQGLFGAPAPQMNLPDRPIRAQGVAAPLFPRQWHLRLSRFPEAWGRATGAGVVVAVPDTGVLGGHPDLQGALLPGLDLLEAGLSAWRPPRASPTASWPSWTATATATAS
uniref:Peptidase S8/S53 domain-containing protein n=1 Tax=Thermus tengchongensis TaxID=1214928 RepID=A0A7V4EGP2_9DEIN